MLGAFTDCASPHALQDLMRDRLAPLGVPLLWGRRSATQPRNLAFAFGVPAVLDASAGSLVMREAALL